MQTLEDAVGDLMPDLLRMANKLDRKIGKTGVKALNSRHERKRRRDRIDAVIEAYKNREMDRIIESTVTGD